jgi:glycosyltransferase involved in cell wall biosynthesis
LIATDVPGCREIVHHGENGLLVPPRDTQALADAIETLVVDAKLRAVMGIRSREIAAAGFSLEKVVAIYQDIYQIPGK